MFVKHISEQDILDSGFVLNSLGRETYSKKLIDGEYLSTYVQIWLDVNTYRYEVITDIEGIVEYGEIRNKRDLSRVDSKFFQNYKGEFMVRCISSELIEDHPNKDNIILAILVREIIQQDEEALDTMFKKKIEELRNG